MKAETIDGAAQQPQPAARDHAGIVRDQRAVENIEIGLEFPDIGIGRGFADRPPGGFDIELQRGRGEPGIDAGYREPIGLAAAMRRGIGRTFGERAQILRRRRQGARPATIRRPARAVPRDRTAAPGSHCSRSVPRITSAVTNGLPSRSPPIQLPIRRNDASSPRAAPVALVQPVLQRAMQPRHLVQEGVVVERQAVGDLVEHRELGPAQQVGLPQRQHRAAQLLVAGLGLFRRELHPFAAVQQRRDLHLAVDGALAADLGRMRGQDRADQRLPKNRRSSAALMPASRACARVRASVPGRGAAVLRARICRMLFWSSAMLARCEK